MERISLEHQLGIYIDNISEDQRFANLEGLGDLARVMVETKKHLSHPLVYRLLKLVLTLYVATATGEIFLCDENCEDYLTQPNG